MNVTFNSVSQHVISFAQERVVLSLTAQQKKILAIAAVIFSGLALCYLLSRRCFKADQMEESSSDEDLDKNKQVFVKKQLLDKIQATPTEASTYLDLGLLLSEDEHVQLLDGTDMKKEWLYGKAIELDPTLASAYLHLGLTLSSSVAIQLSDGTTMTEQQLYLKTIQVDDTFALAYYNLASTLPKNGSIQLPDGTTMTRQQLFLKAIQLDPTFVPAYNDLAANLTKDTTILLDGIEMSRQQLYLKAIQIDPQYEISYLNLGEDLSKDSWVKLLNGVLMTRQQLFLKAIQLLTSSPARVNYYKANSQALISAKAYFCLADTLLDGNSSIKLLDGTRMTKQELYAKAVQLDPNLASHPFTS